MDLEQARIYLERVTNKRITNKELCIALNMDKSNISRKLKEKSKLRQTQIEALECYYGFKLPNNIEDFLKEAQNNYSLLEDIIIKILDYLPRCDLPISLDSAKKAKLIITIYRMVQYNTVKVDDTLIENLIRLMDE